MSAARFTGSGAPHRTVIHLLRHGEVHNPEGILYGRLPEYHLSDLGRRMAQMVADHLAGRRVGLVVASPLERAQETAQPIAAAHELPIRTDERLIEAGNKFEGRRFGHADGSPARPQNWPLLLNPLRPSWGEPYERIAERMERAVSAARAHAAREGIHEVVLVSHQLPIWTLRRHLEERRLWHDPRHRQCSLASLTSLTYEGDHLESIAYSEPAGELLPGADTVPGA